MTHSSASTAPAPRPAARATLLLVDDQPINIQVLYRALAERYRIQVATSGAKALAICRAEAPDLVLLDIVMPEMDGHEVCRELKAHPSTRGIPVIFVTAHHDPAEEALGLALGAVDFIAKPISPAVVRARVDMHVEFARVNRLLAATLDATHDGILVTDLEGQVTLHNERLAQMWAAGDGARARADVRAMADLHAELSRIGDVVPGDDAAAEAGSVMRVQLPGGRRLERRERPLRALGHVVGHVFSYQDVTARETAKEALTRLNEDLESRIAERTRELRDTLDVADRANQAKDELLSNVSHEIRTPLNSILGMSYLALNGELDGRQREFVQQIERSGRQLLGLINDLLDSAKAAAGKLQLERGSVEMGALIGSVVEQQAYAAQAKGLVVQVDVDPVLARPLLGDPLRIGQIIRNYVANAIKFTASGRVCVRAEALEHDDTGARLRIEVQDTGIGLPAEEIGRLFQPFHQADASTTRRYGGTGLGLAISKQLATLMGGEVGAHSVVGQGSCFHLTLRLDWSDGARDEAPVPTCVRLDGLDVLVVEDNEVNRQIAFEILSGAGARVSLAENGQEGVDQVRARRFDCVLMDVQMPVLDGLQATRLIRADPATASTPVIAMTANASRQDEARCRNAGMVDFISKPFEPRQLFALVARHGRRAAAASDHRTPPAEPPAAACDMAPAARDARVIDLAVLQRSLGGNADKVRKFAQLFLSMMGDTLVEIDCALAKADLAALSALGHRAKASACTVGAMTLAQACQDLEDAPARRGLDGAREVVGTLKPLLARIDHEIGLALA